MNPVDGSLQPGVTWQAGFNRNHHHGCAVTVEDQALLAKVFADQIDGEVGFVADETVVIVAGTLENGKRRGIADFSERPLSIRR